MSLLGSRARFARTGLPCVNFTPFKVDLFEINLYFQANCLEIGILPILRRFKASVFDLFGRFRPKKPFLAAIELYAEEVFVFKSRF